MTHGHGQPDSAVRSFQLRLVRLASLTLGLLALAAAALFPLTAGFNAVMLLTDLGSALGFGVAWLLAKRGNLRQASNIAILVGILAIASFVAAEPETPRHHIMLNALVVPILLAFLLDRAWLGGGLIGATVVFLAAHAGSYSHPPGEIQSIAFVILAASSIGAADAFLRSQDRRHIQAAETETGRLRELNEMRMQFINTAAHDLRTPLTPLKLAMASLRLNDAGAGRPERLDMMQRSVARFELLIEDMLDASRLQAGRVTIHRSSIALDGLVQETLATFQDALQKGELKVDASGILPTRADADPLKASQVFMNLISNAVKYTPAGGTVTLSLHGDAKAITFQVQDTGLGMTREQMARLFQPFMRLHEGHPGIAKGTGLGLFISKGLVEAHGGTLAVASDGPSMGSTFTVTLPTTVTPPHGL